MSRRGRCYAAYADDLVCAFRFRSDAAWFYQALPKRLGKFTLEVAPAKTRILRFSRLHPGMTAPVHLFGLRIFLDRRPTGRAARQAPHGSQETAACVQKDQGMDPGESASAGRKPSSRPQGSVARSLPRLWGPWATPRPSIAS